MARVSRKKRVEFVVNDGELCEGVVEVDGRDCERPVSRQCEQVSDGEQRVPFPVLSSHSRGAFEAGAPREEGFAHAFDRHRLRSYPHHLFKCTTI